MSNSRKIILSENALSVILRSVKKFILRKIKSSKTQNLLVPMIDFVAEDYFISGCWEPEIVELIKKSSTHSEVLVDVGANVGITTYQTCQYFKKCILFEPVPALASAAQFNLRHQDNCIIHPHGVARYQEETLIDIPANNTGSAAISPDGSTLCRFINQEQLKKLISPVSPESGVTVKIDVEGLEVDVLTEIHASLTNFTKVIYIIEVNSKEALDNIAYIIPHFTINVLKYSARQNTLTRILSLIRGRTVEMQNASETTKFPCQVYCEGSM